MKIHRTWPLVACLAFLALVSGAVSCDSARPRSDAPISTDRPGFLFAPTVVPAGRVQVLYHETQPLAPGEQKKRGQPEICPVCKGLGYKGRIAIYEILIMDDKL